MRRTLAAVLLSLSCATPCLAVTIHATTTDGKKVDLLDDGTWRWAEAPPAATSTGDHRRSVSASKVFHSSKKYYDLWYDAKKWRPNEEATDKFDLRLTHKSGDGYLMVIAERLTMPIETLCNYAFENVRGIAPDAEIVAKDERVVNGTTVTTMQIRATVQGIKFTYYGYYWAGEAGAMQAITYTAQNIFPELEDDFTELLDGLVILKP